MRIAIALLLPVLACVSVSPAEHFEEFPLTFVAKQGVMIRVKKQETTVAAEIVRKKGDYQVVFLHPLLLTPVLSLRAKGAQLETKILQPEVELPFDPAKILLAIRFLYDARNFKACGSDYCLENEVLRYRFGKFMGAEACRFPSLIHLEFLGENAPQLEISTSDVHC